MIYPIDRPNNKNRFNVIFILYVIKFVFYLVNCNQLIDINVTKKAVGSILTNGKIIIFNCQSLYY